MTRPTSFVNPFPQGVGGTGGDPALPPGQPPLDCCEDEVFPDRALDQPVFVGVPGYAGQAAILNDDPDFFFLFDEPSGSFVDSSGNGVTVSEVGGTATRSVAGPVPDSEGITSDDTGFYLQSTWDANSKTAESVEGWFKTTSTGLFYLFEGRVGGGVGIGLSMAVGPTTFGSAAGQVTAFFNSTSFWLGVHTTATVNDGNWHHLVATWAAPAATNLATSQLKVYIDGVIASTTADSGNTGGPNTSPISGEPYRIVGVPSSATGVSAFALCYFSVELDAADVTAHYDATFQTLWGGTGSGITDGDDTTYQTVDGADVLRIDLGIPFEIARVRLLIGSETSGARSYILKGANEADFSDAVTITTLAWTATGGYVANDVSDTWFATTAYQFWELTGNDETRRIYSFELYEGSDSLASGRWELAVITGSPPDPLYADGDFLYILVG